METHPNLNIQAVSRIFGGNADGTVAHPGSMAVLRMVSHPTSWLTLQHRLDFLALLISIFSETFFCAEAELVVAPTGNKEQFRSPEFYRTLVDLLTDPRNAHEWRLIQAFWNRLVHIIMFDQPLILLRNSFPVNFSVT